MIGFLLTDEEHAELLRRLVQVLPNGPLLDYKQAFGEPARTESASPVAVRPQVGKHPRRGS